MRVSMPAIGLGLCLALVPLWIVAPRTPKPESALPAESAPAARKEAKGELSLLETQALGQNRWLRGGPAALRVIVSNHATGKPLAADVTLSLTRLDNGKPVGRPFPLYSGRTNALGTLDAQFAAPASEAGAYELKIGVHSALGDDAITENVRLEESEQLLLTSDKPVYQPGQTMHLRVLALDMANRTALADKPITLEVEDARGNKVFKQRGTLSKFGIASADFVLADEVNMGTFTLRAVLPETQTEKKVNVARYVLPKFKVGISSDKPYYLPGETVKGTLQANYFFGKPVADSAVEIAVNTIEIGVTKLADLKGKTDAAGTYKFSYKLPEAFVGQPFEQGKAVIAFDATLTDTADHKQESHVSYPVVKEPILLVMVPESRSLVPNVSNRVYIAAATPDGAALKNARIDMTIRSKFMPLGNHTARLQTDDMGLATFDFTTDQKAIVITAKATDANGRTATVTQNLQAAPAQEGIILRVDKTLAKVGERLDLVALCSAKGGTLYLDVIRNRQTILTRAQSMANGQAQISLPLTHDMVGTLELHAYKILPNEDIIRDTRTIVVSPANDLTIEAAADKGEYKPGEDAVLRFTVQDAQRRPVLAALGLAMVDESVFALSELQPGLEKIYFTLEKELMEPKYEIHGLKPTGLMNEDNVRLLREPERQRAAAMLLASVPARSDFDFKVNTYAERWQKMRDEIEAEMVKAQQKIMDAIQHYRADTHTSLKASDSPHLLVEMGYLNETNLHDRWGHEYKFNLYGNNNYDGYFTLSSAGPDGRWNTVDDIVNVSVYNVRRGGRFGRDIRLITGATLGQAGPPGNMEIERAAFAAKKAGAAELMPDGITAGPFAYASAHPVANNGARAKSGAARDDAGGGENVRVREYFPETMYWNPALLTDQNGHAELRLPMADSITTWRMSMIANSTSGQLGSGEIPVKVYQDFFVDIDLPVSLTQNDRVEIPVAVYNYLPTAQKVTLTLEEQPWFALQGSATQTVDMQKGQVKVVHYPIVVKSIGRFPLTVTARGTKLSDAVRRSIDVLPDGKEFEHVINDRLEGKVEKSVTIPANAIAGASSLYVKLYPGAFSQVVEGLDGVLRMPNGCFEQTSSTTYPNILVLDYLKKTKRINPELQLKAESYINVGYQRLVTFECKNGGFSWFGDEPAHQVLTAYGLLEFSDMAKVHEVDPHVIQRTQTWLANQQKPDGTWEETNRGIAEGIINRQTGALRTTAYVAWALAESGYKGPQTAKAVAYVKEHRAEAKDPYTLAVLLNLLTIVDRDGAATGDTANDLIALAKQNEKTAYWEADTQTFTGARREGADLETTGLSAYGLAKWGRNAGFVNKVLTYLVQKKDAFGTWESTQGTVWSMKSLLYASQNGAGKSKGTVTVLANGREAATWPITPDDSDVMRQVSLAKLLRAGANAITIQYQGEGSMLYQIAERHYLPWNQVAPPAPAFAPLSIDVDYDKTTLAQDDTATVTVKIHNKTDRIAEMPLVDVGVPPGFTVLPDKLDAAVQAKTISKYTMAARQVIIYLEKLNPGQTVTLTYQIRARFPIKARTPLSRVYPYYEPQRVAISAPQNITVKK